MAFLLQLLQRVRGAFFMLILTALSSAAHAAFTYSIPSSSANGSIAVTWSGARQFAEVWEYSVAGGDVKLGSGAQSGTYTINKANGTYYFYLKDCPRPPATDCVRYPEQRADVGLPSTPSSINVVQGAGTTNAVVSWTTGGGASTYNLQRTDGAVSTSVGFGTYTDTSTAAGSTYAYKVQGCNVVGCSGWITSSNITITPLAPAAPSSVSASQNPGTTSAGVSWSSVSGATSYNLQRTDGGVSTSTTSTSYTDSSTASGAAYAYKVQACNSGGCSAWTTSASLTITPLAPAAPGSVNVLQISGTTNVAVSWSSVSGATSYKIQRTDGGFSTTLSGTAYTDTSTVGGSSYAYQVQACNSGGCSGWTTSSNISVVPLAPSAPASVSVSQSPGTANVAVSWGAVSGATSYNLQRTDGGLSTSTAGTAYTDTSTVSGGAYTYRVQACNAGGCSSWANSAAITLTPPAPSTVTASVSGGFAALSWNSISGASSYNIQRLDGGVSTSSSTTSFTDTVSVAGTTYTYKVQACNGGGCSAWTNSNPVTVPTPTLSVPGASSTGNYTISWTGGRTFVELHETTNGDVKIYSGSPNSSYNVTGKPSGTYSYYISDCFASTGGTQCTQYGYGQIVVTLPPASPASVTAAQSGASVAISWSSVASATQYNVSRTDGGVSTSTASTSYTDSTAAAGSAYSYKVQACNAGGCSAWVNSNAVTLTPAALGAVTASISGTSGVISWSAVSGASSYNIQRLDGGVSTSTSSTNYADSTTTAGGSYSYKVQACNAGGCSAWATSNSITFVPAALSTVTASISGSSGVISWGSVSGASSYNIQRLDGGVSTSTSSTSYTDATTASGNAYTYKVQACNAGGCSAWVSSNTITFTPPTPGTITASISGSSGVVTWTAISGASSYNIQRLDWSSPVSTGTAGYTDASTAAGGSYSYKVQACNAAGCSSWVTSNTITFVPSAPASITSAQSGSSVQVSWGSSSGAKSYNLQRSDSGAPMSLGSSPYTDSGVTLGSSYSYKVQACNDGGCSAWVVSNTMTVKSGVIISVANNNNDGSFTVNWSGARTFSTLFEYVGPGNYVQVSSGGISGTFDVSGKAAGTYGYRVQDCFQAPVQGSTPSCADTPGILVAVTAPTAPATMTATVAGTAISLSWGASATATSYQVQRNGAALTTATGGVTTYLDTAVVPGMAYNYQVRACKGTSCSAWVASAQTTIPTIPAAPASIVASGSGLSINVIWSSSSGASNYELQRNSAALASGTFTQYADSGVATGVAYIYRVRACNPTGCSGWSEALSFTIPPIPPAPSSVSARVSQSAILISWDAATGAKTYQLKRNGVQISAAASNPFIDNSVTKGQSYTYSVAACNETGCSSFTNSAVVVGGVVQAGNAANERYEYDALGRLKKVQVNGAVKTDYNYDSAGNRTTVNE